MRRWVVRSAGLAVVVAVVLVVVGCGGGSEVLTLDRIGQEDAPKTMTLQLNVDYTHQAPTPSWADGFEKSFTKFAEEHPDWKLELKTIPADATTQEQARLLEAARVGRAPDCANVDSFVVPQFIDQGALKPIDEYFTEEEKQDLFPFVREVVTGEDGKMYAAWWATDLRLLYRRTDLVPEPPRTWDELIVAAKAAE
jgi:multiple sugar transport system substrate-binding protein